MISGEVSRIKTSASEVVLDRHSGDVSSRFEAARHDVRQRMAARRRAAGCAGENAPLMIVGAMLFSGQRRPPPRRGGGATPPESAPRQPRLKTPSDAPPSACRPFVFADDACRRVCLRRLIAARYTLVDFPPAHSFRPIDFPSVAAISLRFHFPISPYPPPDTSPRGDGAGRFARRSVAAILHDASRHGATRVCQADATAQREYAAAPPAEASAVSLRRRRRSRLRRQPVVKQQKEQRMSPQHARLAGAERRTKTAPCQTRLIYVYHAC
jgi:hypothetical protein